MKIVIQYGLFVLLSFLLGGCCMLECIAPLGSSKPYGTQWIKIGVTGAEQREDSWSCGAARTIFAADHVVFSRERLAKEKNMDDKDDFAPRTRLTKSWIGCMESRGYSYQR